MNVDILLVYPPHLKIDFVSSIPHLAAYVKKKGFTVDALDAPTLGLDIHDIVDYVGANMPRSVGISIPFTRMGESGLALVKQLKKFFPKTPLIVGGVHPTLCPDEFKDYAFVCRGEGEVVIARFLEGVKSGAFGPEGFMLGVLTGHIPIEDIVPPDWTIVESDKYVMRMPTGERAFPIQGSRGCIFNCVFCSSKLLFDRGIQYKTMEQIDEEIKDGIKQFGVKNIVFRDENITLNKERFASLCFYLRMNKIKWWAQTRANLINEKSAFLAKISGCVGISIGVETGDPYVMGRIKKGITLDQVVDAFRILKAAGLKTAANFMIGHLWDSPLSIQRTLDFADKIDPNYFGIQIATPFPGTEFRKLVLEKGIELKENWRNYDTSRMNYSPINLKGYNLKLMKNKVERAWYYRKPSRFLCFFSSFSGLRSGLRNVRRILWMKT
jgi:radical SAM superfamily enzyme YgiQ (UPF0313 family)